MTDFKNSFVFNPYAYDFQIKLDYEGLAKLLEVQNSWKTLAIQLKNPW